MPLFTIEERSKRRKRVLELNQMGKTQPQIAKELSVSEWTVKDDLKQISKQENAPKIRRAYSKEKRIKWIRVINAIIKSLPYFTSRNIKPSLRTIYYKLESESYIEKTESEYGNLIQRTVQARLGELDANGEPLYPKLPIDCFADENRRLIDYYNALPPREPENENDYIDEAIEYLKNTPGDYDGQGTRGGYWFGQPEYVEVWIEKFALAPTFESFLSSRHVNIVVNKGYSSLSFLWENCKRLKEKIKEFGVDHVHVLYFGDFDPSGQDMDRVIKEYFELFDVDPGIFERVSLTPTQIQQYNIPTRPVKTKPKPGKKKADLNAKGFITKYGNKAAEIDAFFAVNPKAFEKMVQSAVDKLYDQSIYDEMVKKYKTEIPAIDLKQIHSKMFERITESFRPGWEKDYAADIEYKEEE